MFQHSLHLSRGAKNISSRSGTHRILREGSKMFGRMGSPLAKQGVLHHPKKTKSMAQIVKTCQLPWLCWRGFLCYHEGPASNVPTGPCMVETSAKNTDLIGNLISSMCPKKSDGLFQAENMSN